MRHLPRIKVLIAHEDQLISAGLAATLERRCDFELVKHTAVTVQDKALPLPSADVVITDYELGLRIMEAAGRGAARILILTHSDSEAKICHALERGVRGYILLGCSLEDIIGGLRSVYLGGTALGPRVTSRLADRMQQQAFTRREREILQQMMRGLSNKEIASSLTITVDTVKVHVKSVLSKLGAARRTQAVVIAQRRGILGDEPLFGNLA